MIKARVERIQKELSVGQALLVTSDCNRFYFTGFASSAGSVFICPQEAVFLIDFRYFEKAKATVDSCTVVQSPPAGVSELCQKYGIKELFIEATSTPVSRLAALRRDLPGVTVSDSDKFDGIIADMRCIKTEAELALIREAQRMTDETFSYILNHISPGRTEKEIMLDMEFFMRRLGSEGVSFD